jgi:raffinose/stachyose/melibiose transport system substrate-binding protein
LAIPAVKGTADAIQDPLLKEIAQQIERSEWLKSPMDQVLGPDTGRVFNDVSTDIASGNSTPDKRFSDSTFTLQNQMNSTHP